MSSIVISKNAFSPASLFTPIFQVSEFNELINNHLGLLGEVIIEGELSRLEIKNHRLIFATLKDKQSVLDLFSLTHLVQDYSQFQAGMLVTVTGTAGLYKGSGKFRLMVTNITPKGEGAQKLALEKLKDTLQSEGLFDESRKRSLPSWPQRIGLLTASNSSAFHDVVKIISTRMGGITIKHLPINVQGSLSIGSIKNAISFCNKHSTDFDLLILCRGGGSQEDLQAFNDESVARAVFGSVVPIISAIGHEDNWSLTDYTADLRASTPSNAAELAVPDRREVILELDSRLNLLNLKLNNQIRSTTRQLQLHAQALAQGMAKPKSRAEQLFTNFSKSAINLSALHHQSVNQLIIHKLNLLSAVESQVKSNKHQLQELENSLGLLDPQKVLNRGYSITRDAQGRVIKNINQIQAGQQIHTTISDGIISSITLKQKG